MRSFKKKPTRQLPKIVCKIKWFKTELSSRKYLKADFACFGPGICERILELGAGREVYAPRRNRGMWTTYPSKSNATMCLRITKMEFPKNTSYNFYFWNIKPPKPLGRIICVDNRISITKKYTALKRRLDKWK